jgi:hypothetical protein
MLCDGQNLRECFLAGVTDELVVGHTDLPRSLNGYDWILDPWRLTRISAPPCKRLCPDVALFLRRLALTRPDRKPPGERRRGLSAWRASTRTLSPVFTKNRTSYRGPEKSWYAGVYFYYSVLLHANHFDKQ